MPHHARDTVFRLDCNASVQPTEVKPNRFYDRARILYPTTALTDPEKTILQDVVNVSSFDSSDIILGGRWVYSPTAEAMAICLQQTRT